jgi:hypothetical protein
MGLRSVWVDRDLTGHPAKVADRRITAMRRLRDTVTDVSALAARAYNHETEARIGGPGVAPRKTHP